MAYIEELFEEFLVDPNRVSSQWRDYFNKLPLVDSSTSGALQGDVSHRTIVEHFERLGQNRLKARPEKVATAVSSAHERKQVRG